MDKHFINGMTYFKSKFPDEETCRQHRVGRRWPTGVVTCPYCGQSVTDENLTGDLECPLCGKKFDVTSRTMYEGDIPLRKWYILQYMYILAETVPLDMVVAELELPADVCSKMCEKISSIVRELDF